MPVASSVRRSGAPSAGGACGPAFEAGVGTTSTIVPSASTACAEISRARMAP